MAWVNRYFRFSKISEAKFRSLLRCFALDMTATQTARMTGISLRSVNQIFLRLREKLARECEMRSPFVGHLEADESYFGPAARCARLFKEQIQAVGDLPPTTQIGPSNRSSPGKLEGSSFFSAKVSGERRL